MKALVIGTVAFVLTVTFAMIVLIALGFAAGAVLTLLEILVEAMSKESVLWE